MFPHERSLVQKFAGKPFALVGVNSDKDREKLKQVMKDKNLTWRSFWNGGGTRGPISNAWNVSSWPTIYILDASGKIRFKNVRDKALEAALAMLVSQAESH